MLIRRSINNDMVFGQGLSNFATRSEACAQNLVTRLRTFLGEWFMDTSFGVGYTQDILVNNPNVALAEADLKAMIISSEDVDELLSFSFNVNTATRQASLDASVNTVYGDTVDIQVNI